MRILFVTEAFPYPLDTGGNIRTFHILKGLARAHEVTLLSIAPQAHERREFDGLGVGCREVVLVPQRARSIGRELRALVASYAGPTPFVLRRHRRRELGEKLAALMGHRPRFDAIHYNHLDAALYADAVPDGTLGILDQHNVVSNQLQSMMGTEPSAIRRRLMQIDLRKLRRYEVSACNRMDRVLACSEADAKALRTMGVLRAPVVAPNGVDLDYFEPRWVPSARSADLVFVGTLDYGPCEVAVWHFCTEVLPLLWTARSELRFVVVGRNPSARIAAVAAREPRIVLAGRVPDIRPHVYGARVFVVPLKSGSGTRLKILEALGMGIPVVTTTIGIEGIDAVNGEHALVADSASEMADAILRCLQDELLAKNLSTAGRLLVEQRYSWERVQQLVLDEYSFLRETRASGV